MKKLSNQNNKKIQEQTVDLLDSIGVPFAGTTIQSNNKQYHVSRFKQISISGVGPVFYINKKNQKIYTVLQRRYQDNFQWLFSGGYVEIPPANCENPIVESGKKVKMPSFDDIKKVTMKGIYHKMIDQGCWQKTKKELNDPETLNKIFKEKGIKWPKEIDANWQSAWQREVLEETGVDLDKFPKKIIAKLPFVDTLMIGAEPDRLTNIDGTYTAMLGILEKEPKVRADAETEEVKWIALDEIKFDTKKKKYLVRDYMMNSYTFSLLEESLHNLICKEIELISKIKNLYTKQEISKFNSPQNLQSFLIEKSQNFDIKSLSSIQKFLSWKFGVLDIAQNLCSENGNWFYHANIAISKFISAKNLDSISSFKSLEKTLSKIS